jgi:(R)-2-hydroxyacyl-CoA dehydratese activating ATPase
MKEKEIKDKDPVKAEGCVVGIDVGSLSTEALVFDMGGDIAGYAIVQTGANSTDAALSALEKALAASGMGRDQIRQTVATGYGRVSIPFADKQVTEISCHAIGAYSLFPDTSLVIDIGGQDSKVIRLGKGGKVLDFAMNDKCAAGTGRFLEVMADKLQVGLDDMGPLCLKANREVLISSVCTVFAESEIVSLVARNHPKEEIIRGLHRAIVNRVWSMVKGIGVGGPVTMSGGVAKNLGVVKLMEEKLGQSIHVYSEPQIVGALGAALMARRAWEKGLEDHRAHK